MAAHAAIHEEEELGRRLARLESLVEDLQQLPDAGARAAAEEIIQAVLELHAAGLRRVFEVLAAAGEQGEPLLAGLAADELVGSLMLLHGLHPVDLRARVEEALEQVRPYMKSHGGGVELLGVEGEVVRLRLDGSCHGCPSSAMTMKLAVEKAIYEVAPDVAGIEVEGVTAAAAAPAAPPVLSGLVPLPMMGAGGSAAAAPAAVPAGPPTTIGRWVDVDGLGDLDEGEVRSTALNGVTAVVCRRDATLYAYRAGCPACADPMSGARLADGALVCPGCGRHYGVREVGRSSDAAWRLEPLPLLEEGGRVRIAEPVEIA